MSGQALDRGAGDRRESELLDGLLRFTVGVLDARDPDELAGVVTELGAPLIGAVNATVGVVERDSPVLRVYRGPNTSQADVKARRILLEEPAPLADVVRTGAPLTIESEAEFGRRYPRIAARIAPGQMLGVVGHPLRDGQNIIGGCFFRFDRENAIDEQTLARTQRVVPIIEHALARLIERSELEFYTRRLEQSNRDLDAFAAVAAHDLTAPVRRIGSFTQLLAREFDDLSPKAQGYLDRIRGQIDHLSALLRDTLAYAQVVGLSSSRTQVELRSLVDGACESLAEDLSEVGAHVEIGELARVDVEPTLITQVLIGLLENAIKYRCEHVPPQVEIRAELDDRDDTRHWWRISVSDNGIGIEPDRVDEVFGMFSRLEVSDDRPGTGIGLAFVKRIVERHGGEVGVGDGIDGGASIWFTLPGEPDADHF